jgi:hypothetical protein
LPGWKSGYFLTARTPQGFVSSIYLGETAICQPLWDPEVLIAKLKSRVSPYPIALQKAVIQKFAWEIDFSIGIAQKSIAREDVVYTVGCCLRSVMCMLQVLFAINKEHYLLMKRGLWRLQIILRSNLPTFKAEWVKIAHY